MPIQWGGGTSADRGKGQILKKSPWADIHSRHCVIKQSTNPINTTALLHTAQYCQTSRLFSSIFSNVPSLRRLQFSDSWKIRLLCRCKMQGTYLTAGVTM
jgi:hypothetical protein